MGNLQKVNAKELGEVVDMVKDLEEALYYCTIVEAMEDKENLYSSESPSIVNYYTPHYRDMDRAYGRTYYGNDSVDRNSSSSYDSRNYTPYMSEYNMRDSREGQSPTYRKMYMETKEMHKDKNVAMKDLEEYMHSLSSDITEMINGASPEEKQLLQSKLAALANKIK